MITLTASSSLSFDGYQIVAITTDAVNGLVTIAYRQTLQGTPVDPTGMSNAWTRLALADFDALAGSTTIARASAAVADALKLSPSAFAVS